MTSPTGPMRHNPSQDDILTHANDDAESGSTLFLLSSLAIGGSERKTIRIVNELYHRGRDVHVAYLNPPTTLLNGLNSEIPVEHLERTGKISFKSIRSLRDYFTQEEIRNVVCVNLYPLIYALAARRLLNYAAKPQVIVTINSTTHIGIKDRVAMLLYTPLIKRADQVIFGCRAQLDLWCESYGLDEKQCSVIYNGVDEVRFSAGSADICSDHTSAGLTLSDDFLIGTVGQLRPVKNHIELISVLAHLQATLPRARLVIVGDGSERAKLERAARELGVSERVSFLGELDDVRPIMEMMDVFVVPSISETFSNAALEAMSMGKAVILSDTGGAREMVQDGVNGYVYEQGNIEAVTALIKQLAADSESRQEVGDKARKTVIQRFSFESMVRQYQRLTP